MAPKKVGKKIYIYMERENEKHGGQERPITKKERVSGNLVSSVDANTTRTYIRPLKESRLLIYLKLTMLLRKCDNKRADTARTLIIYMVSRYQLTLEEKISLAKDSKNTQRLFSPVRRGSIFE